jgi:hypothetical protein
MLTGCFSNAATQVRFLPGDRNFLTNVMEKDSQGNSDTDATDLYLTMNVEEQDSMLGKGKSIKSRDKDFNLVCSQARKHCSIILNSSSNTIISSSQKIASFKVTGAEAKSLTQKFKLNERGEAFFQASDKLFRIFGTSDSFLFEAIGEN